MNKSDNRQYGRYDAQRDVSYNFMYDFESSIELSSEEKKKIVRYTAQTQNVSLEGICFKSDHILKKGDELTLDVYVPGDDNPVHMHGLVCWSCLEINSRPEVYKTGVKLTDVEGKLVGDTVRFDEEYHVYWSDVLESILGKFRILQQKAQGKPIVP